MPKAKKGRGGQATENVRNRNVLALQFVTVIDLNQPLDPGVQKTVRQHAMKDYRRRTQKSHEDHYLDITPLLVAQSSSQHPELDCGAHERSKLAYTDLMNPNLSMEVGASNVNPFPAYPLHMTSRNSELFYHRKLRHPLRLQANLRIE